MHNSFMIMAFLVLAMTSSITTAIDVADMADDTAKSVCATSDGCNTNFFNLANYCCGFVCCDVVSFVLQDEK